MNRAITTMIISHLPHYQSEVHILQASILINAISLNRKIGGTRIPMIQLLCNCPSVGNLAHFHTTCENKVDEQSHRERYVDSWTSSSRANILINNIFWTICEDNWTKPLVNECRYTMRTLCDKRTLDALVQSAQNKWTKLRWYWCTSHIIVDQHCQHLIFVSKWR
jgi:hypothetical protein